MQTAADRYRGSDIAGIHLQLTGAWSDPQGLEGASLTSAAFERVYGRAGGFMVDFAVVLFAFSTIISWSYYGEQGVAYLFGSKRIPIYRYVFIAVVLIGALWELKPVLDLSDAVFGLLALPNILANILLIGKLSKETKKYVADLRAGKFAKTG